MSLREFILSALKGFAVILLALSLDMELGSYQYWCFCGGAIFLVNTY